MPGKNGVPFPHPGRMVTKVGTSVVSNGHGLDKKRIYQICEDLSGVIDGGTEVFHVTSGASMTGMALRGIEKETYREKFKNDMERYYRHLQLFSTQGQPYLMRNYDKGFLKHGKSAAQFLVARDDIEKFRGTLDECYGLGIVPVINENDCKTGDITYENLDNDTLSAMICGLVDAGMLAILSDCELHDKDPHKYGDARKIDVIYSREITDDMINGTNGIGFWGKGGMKTKVAAMKSVTGQGRYGMILSYKTPGYGDMRIADALAGRYRGTLFLP